MNVSAGTYITIGSQKIYGGRIEAFEFRVPKDLPIRPQTLQIQISANVSQTAIQGTAT